MANTDQETENEFHRNMDMVQNLRIPAHVIVDRDNAVMVGLVVLFLGECVNDNVIGFIDPINETGALL